MLLKKALPTSQTNQSNKAIREIIELLQQQNKIVIEENKSKTITFIEMLVEILNKLRNDQNSAQKFEVVRKYR